MIKLIKYFLNLFGIYIYRSDWKLHYKNQEKKNKAKISFNELYSKYYNKKNNKLIIFDVGANTGQSIKRFNNEFNLKEIHCFEPNVPAFEKLKKIKLKNIFLNNLALGDKEKIQTFNNYPKTSSSSFYRIDKKSSIYEMNKGFYSSNVKIISIPYHVLLS